MYFLRILMIFTIVLQIINLGIIDKKFYILIQSILLFSYSPNVQLCGYTMPHPAEHMINLRIETSGEDAIEVLRRGLEDLEKICDITIERFEEAYEKFKAKNTSADTT